MRREVCRAAAHEVANRSNLGRITSQNGTIAEYERRIALLQLNLAVRVAIEDDDDLEDAADESNAAEADVAVDVEALQAELATAVVKRGDLEQQLAAVQSRLDDAVARFEAAVASVAELNQELLDSRAETAARQQELADATAAFDKLSAEAQAATRAIQLAEDRLADSQGVAEQARERVRQLEADVALAAAEQERLLAANAEHSVLERRLAEVRSS